MFFDPTASLIMKPSSEGTALHSATSLERTRAMSSPERSFQRKFCGCPGGRPISTEILVIATTRGKQDLKGMAPACCQYPTSCKMLYLVPDVATAELRSKHSTNGGKVSLILNGCL